MLRPDEWINDADNHFYEPTTASRGTSRRR